MVLFAKCGNLSHQFVDIIHSIQSQCRSIDFHSVLELRIEGSFMYHNGLEDVGKS